MTRVLFVDHAMHRATESSGFFTSLLETRFEVSRLYVSPNGRHAFDWQFVAGFDIVVLWQMDYLAPLFLARGHRTVVVPMYDGSAGLPQVHWACAAGAGFVNFSRALHERVRLLGLDSLLVKYFPEAVAEAELPNFDGLRAFLWQRRPEDGITADLVGRLLGSQMDSLHVHNVPDDPAMTARFPPPSSIGDAPVTVSEWFADRAGYYRVLRDCNVFVCPRMAEGIGMAMVEAMARGMLVVANDLPSHNEYVCNWVNGVLFDTAQVGEANFGAASAIARMGWRTVRDGRARWLASADRILAFVARTARYRAAEPKILAELEHDLVPAYLAGGEIYERFLLKLLPALATRHIADETDIATKADPTVRSRTAATERQHFPVVIVPERTAEAASVAIAFANGAARPLLGNGWSVDETFGVWIEGVRAELSFAASVGFPVASLMLRVLALAPGEDVHQTGLGVTVNGVAASRAVSVNGGGPRELRCEIALPMPLTSSTWHIEFCCDRTLNATGDARRLSIAVIALSVDFRPAVTAVAQPVTISAIAAPVGNFPPALQSPHVKLAARPAARISNTAPAAPWRSDLVGPRQAAATALDRVVRKAGSRSKLPLAPAAKSRAQEREKV